MRFGSRMGVCGMVGGLCVMFGGGLGPAHRDGFLMLADFEGQEPRIDPLSGEWRTVNDNIMGGRSKGGGEIRDGVMVFAGSTNTNGGGFSSVRASDKRWDVSAFDGIAARVRADGRTYVFHLDTGRRYRNGNVFYRGRFDTARLITAGGERETGVADAEGVEDGWQHVFVRFEDFLPMVRGRVVDFEPLERDRIRGIGLMIDDGLDGPFRLEADWIHAETEEHHEGQSVER